MLLFAIKTHTFTHGVKVQNALGTTLVRSEVKTTGGREFSGTCRLQEIRLGQVGRLVQAQRCKVRHGLGSGSCGQEGAT